MNICHLFNKLDELKSSVSANKPLIDICGFTETFLSGVIGDSSAHVDGFNFYRRDRGTGLGGGIMVYVSNKWNTQRRRDIETNKIETIWLEISFTQTEPLLVCCLSASKLSCSLVQ